MTVPEPPREEEALPQEEVQSTPVEEAEDNTEAAEEAEQVQTDEESKEENANE